MRYTYDAWNRLVKVQSSKDGGAVTIQTAEFFADGRRANKVVTKSGTYDGTFRYLYDGQKIVEIRNGSGQMVQQFLHGTQYIDELIMVRVKDKGDLYVHQDANWNVIGTTDLGRHVVEHDFLSPYGELTVNQETSFGDRDGDGDVDSTDKGAVGTTCTGTVSGACRILDLDFDGDYDSTDATKFDALTQGYMVRPGLAATATSQPFAHQGLLFEPEIASYQNRARQYDPSKMRFVQRDPLLITRDVVTNQAHRLYLAGLFAYVRADGNSLTATDPFGLCTCRAIQEWRWDYLGQEETFTYTWTSNPGCSCGFNCPPGKMTCTRTKTWGIAMCYQIRSVIWLPNGDCQPGFDCTLLGYNNIANVEGVVPCPGATEYLMYDSGEQCSPCRCPYL